MVDDPSSKGQNSLIFGKNETALSLYLASYTLSVQNYTLKLPTISFNSSDLLNSSWALCLTTLLDCEMV